MRSVVAIVVALPWVGWALLRTLGVEVPFPLVAAIAFTPYAALTSPLPVLLALLLRRKGIAVLSAVAAAALGLAMVPRAVAGPQPEAQGPRLVVMTSNLWLGNADERAVLRIAREHDVDVISLQELRPRNLKPLESEHYPQRLLRAEPGAGGSGLLSRLPMRATNAAAAAAHQQPEAVITVAGAPPVTIKAVHPRPPVNRAAEPDWRAALAAMPGSDSRGDVRILAGDFNATLDHSEFRALLARGYVDAADAAGAGLTPTWPARARRHRALPLTIDHVLVDRRVRVEKVTVVRIPTSDHKAVIAQLRLPAG